MRNLVVILAFAALTCLCWGVFGPVLFQGQFAMRGMEGFGNLRPLMGVGIMFFLIAVAAPIARLVTKGEEGCWSLRGIAWSCAAGIAAAAGTLCVLWAFRCHASPIYVMPLVFGFTPVVHAAVRMWMTGTLRVAGKVFCAAVIVILLGAAGALVFMPKATNVGVMIPEEKTEEGPVTVEIVQLAGTEVQTSRWTAESMADLKSAAGFGKAYRLYLRKQSLTIGQFFGVVFSILIAAACFGCSAAVLQHARSRMAGSLLRPFICIGAAYLVVAVVVPIVWLANWTEPGQWTVAGTLWSLIAGGLAAAAVLGLVMAFQFGGRAIYVLPTVFGGTIVVNLLAMLAVEGSYQTVTTPFLVSLLLVILGVAAALALAAMQKPKREEADRESSEPDDGNDAPDD